MDKGSRPGLGGEQGGGDGGDVEHVFSTWESGAPLTSNLHGQAEKWLNLLVSFLRDTDCL